MFSLLHSVFVCRTMKTVVVLLLFSVCVYVKFVESAVNMKQFQDTLQMMRSICQPKHKVSTEMLDGLKKGAFVEDRDLKCYTKCIAQMTGTLTKKGEISNQRMLAQIDVIIPDEMRDKIREMVDFCKNVQNNYKDTCDKTFYTAKCGYEFSPPDFYFP